MDIDQQIKYWVVTSEEDFAAAQSLLEKGHLRHCLFFAHLAIEKMLKAHVIKLTKDMPPRIHNLFRLTNLAKLKPDEKQQEFLRRFDVYQLEGRYPDSEEIFIDDKIAKQEISTTREILEWLKVQL